MIAAIFLCGISFWIEGSNRIIGNIVSDLAGGAAKAAETNLGRLAAKSGIRLDGIVTEQFLAEALQNAESVVTKQLGVQLDSKVVAELADDLVANSLKAFEKNTGDLINFSSAALRKSVAEDFSTMTSGELETVLKAAKIAPSKIDKTLQEFNASKSMFGKTMYKTVSSTGRSVSRLMGKTDKLIDSAEYMEAKNILKTSMDAEKRAGAATLIAEREWQAACASGKALRLLKSGVGSLHGPLMMAGGTITAAILFMIPSIFQSSFLAEEQKNAMLKTYIPPTSFGNVVLQLADSAINMSEPASSIFIYYAIPVSNPGDKLSPEAAALYPGVSGPTNNNPISKEISSTYTQVFSLGGAKKVSIPRYNLDEHAMATLPIYVSYSTQSWLSWASNGIPDASFSQMLINLNTGGILYADGTCDGTPPAGLVGSGSGTTVQSFLTTEYGKLKTSGLQSTYKEYVDAYTSSKSNTVSSSLADQFNCACLQNNNGILSSATTKSCSTAKSSTCLIANTLNQLSAGLVLNSAGTVMTPDQDLAQEIAKGALGQVIPIQGLGKQFNSVLQMFPGAQQTALANSGALTISLGANTSAAATRVQGAEPDNYVAKGVYVYQCTNTPLAKMLRSQAGGSATSGYANYITDYIVFLDENLNQVPLMTPLPDPKNYNFMKMTLNPAIKYYSTIIGTFDGNGQFSFIPQLNIQSPPALTAKGLPATFAPLYSLQAVNGSSAVNYNQNLTATIGAIAQALLGHGKLGQQFKTLQSAMIQLLSAGPFGKYQLQPVPAAMQPQINGITLMMYTGYNGYPVSQDAANDSCTDVLIPLSAQGQTVTLPSSNVAQYYGLVTDLTYSVRPDGTIAVDATGFNNSPLSASMTIDQTKVTTFYWMNKLTAMGRSSNSQFTLPSALVSFVQAARSAWIQWIQANASQGSSAQQFTGVPVPGTGNVLTIANQQALRYGLYIYTCSPCPSTLAQDYFVLTNNSAPQVSDGTLGTMQASAATAATNMVSLVSGILYNASGAQVKSSTGAAYSVSPIALVKALNSQKPQAFSDAFKAQLNIAIGQSTATAQAMVYPFAFGGLQLGIYQADLSAGIYLYCNAAGAGTSANFVPSDYFVVIDSYSNPSQVGTKLSPSSAYVVSLVSGVVYGPNAAVATMSSQLLTSLIQTLSPSWRSGVAAQIDNLTAQVAAQQKNNQQLSDAMNNANTGTTASASVTLSQAAVAKIILNLASQKYLANPYAMLKQDPTSGMYVLISPASADGTQSLYTFFDVPNSFADSNGKPMRVGAVYDDQANLLHVIKGVQLVSMMHQYGVSVDVKGNQYLGANNIVPIMQLDPADKGLQPGMNGKSMVYSNNASFPAQGIVSPITYGSHQFYIYYNLLMQGYYAMDVNGSDVRYIDMAGGNVYNIDGSPRPAFNPVAFNSNGATNDLLLPYLNINSFVRCMMKNPSNNNLYSDFINSETDFQDNAQDPATGQSCGLNSLYSVDGKATNAQVAQMPFPESLTVMPDITVANQYSVYWNQSAQPISYAINPAYQWQQLQLLPIDMTTRAILSPLPSAMYSAAGLIMKSNVPYAVVFAGQLFGNGQKTSSGSYIMSAGANKITTTIKLDAKTNAKYVEILANGTTYNYQMNFLTLTDGQLLDFRRNGWQADVVADVTGKIVLEAYLPNDGAGNVQLSPISINTITNLPTDQNALAALNNGIANIMQDTVKGRFVVAISANSYPYFTQDGYVDIENGALFDATGVVVGYTLLISDVIALLNQLSVRVMRDTHNTAVLQYRPSGNVPASVPAANNTSSVASATVSASTIPSSSASVQSGASAVQVPTAALANGQSSTANSGMSAAQVRRLKAISNLNKGNANNTNQDANQPLSSNPSIAKLQQQNIGLQADIKKRTAAEHNEALAAKKKILQNAILTDNQQIAANNKQIAALQALQSSSANTNANQARSMILGRLSGRSKYTPAA